MSVVPLVPLVPVSGVPGSCPARLVGSIWLGYASVCPARPPKYRASTSQQWRQLMPMSCGGNACPTAEGRDWNWSLQPIWRQGFLALTSLCPKKMVGYDQSWVCASWNWAFHNLLSSCSGKKRIFGCIRPQDRSAAVDLKDPCLPCVDLSGPQISPTVCVQRTGISVQGPALRAVPIAPCLHESSGGSPCSLERKGRVHSQLPRRLAHSGSVSGSVMRTQGFGALAPQPVGPLGQLEKEQTLPDAEDLFSRYGVGLGQSDSAPHAGTFSVSVNCLNTFKSRTAAPLKLFQRLLGHMAAVAAVTYVYIAAPYEIASTLTPQSRGGHGSAAHSGSELLRPAATSSPRDQTFRFFGQKCPWNRSPGRLWFTRMPPSRAGGTTFNRLAVSGFGRVPNCTGTSTA